MAEKIYAGEIPESIFLKEIEKFKKARDAASGKLKHGEAQFKYNGKTYTIMKNSGHKHGHQVTPAWKEARKAGTRRGRAKNQQIQLSSIEQMMVDNMYQEAAERGLVVDHINPIALGAPSNAPWNLKLRDAETNSKKGATLGGNWASHPLILPYMSKHDLTMRQTAPQGSFNPLPQTTAHGGSGYRAPLTSAKQGTVSAKITDPNHRYPKEIPAIPTVMQIAEVAQQVYPQLRAVQHGIKALRAFGTVASALSGLQSMEIK